MASSSWKRASSQGVHLCRPNTGGCSINTSVLSTIDFIAKHDRHNTLIAERLWVKISRAELRQLHTFYDDFSYCTVAEGRRGDSGDVYMSSMTSCTPPSHPDPPHGHRLEHHM